MKFFHPFLQTKKFYKFFQNFFNNFIFYINLFFIKQIYIFVNIFNKK